MVKIKEQGDGSSISSFSTEKGAEEKEGESGSSESMYFEVEFEMTVPEDGGPPEEMNLKLPPGFEIPEGYELDPSLFFNLPPGVQMPEGLQLPPGVTMTAEMVEIPEDEQFTGQEGEPQYQVFEGEYGDFPQGCEGFPLYPGESHPDFPQGYHPSGTFPPGAFPHGAEFPHGYPPGADFRQGYPPEAELPPGFPGMPPGTEIPPGFAWAPGSDVPQEYFMTDLPPGFEMHPTFDAHPPGFPHGHGVNTSHGFSTDGEGQQEAATGGSSYQAQCLQEQGHGSLPEGSGPQATSTPPPARHSTPTEGINTPPKPGTGPRTPPRFSAMPPRFAGTPQAYHQHPGFPVMAHMMLQGQMMSQGHMIPQGHMMSQGNMMPPPEFFQKSTFPPQEQSDDSKTKQTGGKGNGSKVKKKRTLSKGKDKRPEVKVRGEGEGSDISAAGTLENAESLVDCTMSELEEELAATAEFMYSEKQPFEVPYGYIQGSPPDLPEGSYLRESLGFDAEVDTRSGANAPSPMSVPSENPPPLTTSEGKSPYNAGLKCFGKPTLGPAYLSKSSHQLRSEGQSSGQPRLSELMSEESRSEVLDESFPTSASRSELSEGKSTGNVNNSNSYQANRAYKTNFQDNQETGRHGDAVGTPRDDIYGLKKEKVKKELEADKERDKLKYGTTDNNALDKIEESHAKKRDVTAGKEGVTPGGDSSSQETESKTGGTSSRSNRSGAGGQVRADIFTRLGVGITEPVVRRRHNNVTQVPDITPMKDDVKGAQGVSKTSNKDIPHIPAFEGDSKTVKTKDDVTNSSHQNKAHYWENQTGLQGNYSRHDYLARRSDVTPGSDSTTVRDDVPPPRVSDVLGTNAYTSGNSHSNKTETSVDDVMTSRKSREERNRRHEARKARLQTMHRGQQGRRGNTGHYTSDDTTERDSSRRERHQSVFMTDIYRHDDVTPRREDVTRTRDGGIYKRADVKYGDLSRRNETFTPIDEIKTLDSKGHSKPETKIPRQPVAPERRGGFPPRVQPRYTERKSYPHWTDTWRDKFAPPETRSATVPEEIYPEIYTPPHSDNIFTRRPENGGAIPKTTVGTESLFPRTQAPDPSQPMTKGDYGRWQQELERIQKLHATKVNRLEAQLSHTRDESSRYEEELEKLQAKCRMQESLAGADPEIAGLAAGLCIRCGQNEAVLPPSAGASHKQSIDSITRERDELMDQLTLVRAQYERLKQSETNSYGQVKSACQMVEQAQLEMTQAMIEREQLKEELINMRKRMEDHSDEMNKRMQDERELVRLETKTERQEMNDKIQDLTEKFVSAQNALEKTARDKMSLLTELESTRGNLDMFDMDYGKATDSMKMSMTQATIERNSAVGQMMKMKKELDLSERERGQEKNKLKMELDGVRGRLSLAERDLVETKEECIHLTNTVQSLERETHLAKLAKESIERNRNDDVKAARHRAEQREAELNLMLDQMEAKAEKSTGQLEDIVSNQARLIQRLREECRKLARQLEDNMERYRKDNRKLKNSNEQLKMRLDKSLRRLKELESTHKNQGSLQEKMRDRLKQMDTHSAHSSSQLVELLAKESALMRERQLLAKEVEFLRHQMTSNDKEHGEERLYSPHKVLVDDVLVSVKQDSMTRRQALLSLPAEKGLSAHWDNRKEYMDLPELAGETQQGETTPRSQSGDTPRSHGSDVRSASADED